MTIVQKDAAVNNPNGQACPPCSSELIGEGSRSDHLDVKTVVDRVFPGLCRELNAILGFTEFLDSEGAEQVEIIDDIRRSAQKLASFLDLYGKGVFHGRGGYEYSIGPCSIPTILKQIDVLKRPAAAKKEIEFKIVKQSSVPDTICCDPEWLRLSLVNLVDNAIQYTHQGQVVMTVSMGSGAAGDRVKFEIRDTGPGIRDEQLLHLFEPFWQVEEDRFHNFGLGLFLTKRFAEAVDGSIGVASELDKGTTFCLELPVESGEQAGQGHLVRPSSMEIIRKLTAVNTAFMNRRDVSEESASDTP